MLFRKTVDACDGRCRLALPQLRLTEKLASYVGFRDNVGIEYGDVQSRMSQCLQRDVHACQVGYDL